RSRFSNTATSAQRAKNPPTARPIGWPAATIVIPMATNTVDTTKVKSLIPGVIGRIVGLPGPLHEASFEHDADVNACVLGTAESVAGRDRDRSPPRSSTRELQAALGGSARPPVYPNRARSLSWSSRSFPDADGRNRGPREAGLPRRGSPYARRVRGSPLPARRRRGPSG